MKIPARPNDSLARRICLLALALLALCLAAPLLSPAAIAVEPAEYSTKDFSQDISKAEALTKHLHVPLDEVLGPLAPLALSPFFALMLLSGTSLLVDQGVLNINNHLLQGNPVLANEWVFITLLGLTIFTSLPRMTKVSKAVAQTADFLETHAGIVIYIAILALALSPWEVEPSGPQIVYHAGIFEFSGTTLLMVLCVVNVLIINAIRVFFELLVFLCPVPAVDAVFEIANKLFCLALAVAYLISPMLAAVFDGIIFITCLFAYALVHRRLTHYRALLLDPVIAGIRARFIQDGLALRHRTILEMARSKAEVEADAPILKVFPDRAIGRAKKREKSYLVPTAEGPLLIRPRIFGGSIYQKMGSAAGQQLYARPGILQNSIRIEDGAGQTVVKLCYTRAWNAYLPQLRAAFGAGLDEDASGLLLQKTLATGKQSLLDLGRGLAGSVAAAQKAAGTPAGGSVTPGLAGT